MINIKKMTSEKDELFDYQEKVIFVYGNDLILRNIQTKTNLITRSHNVFVDEFRFVLISSALSYDKEKITFVGLYKYLPQDNTCNFGVVQFDKNLIIEKKFYSIKPFMRCKDMLLTMIPSLNYDIDSVIAKFGSDPLLPKGIKLIKDYSYRVISDYDRKFRPMNMCYDQYDDTLIIAFGNDTNECQLLEIWTKNNEWQLQKRSQQLIFFENCIYITMNHFGCGRSNIFIGLRECPTFGIFYTSYILDKKTFEIVDNFSGTHPVLYDDFDEWHNNRLTLLKDIDVLKRLSTSLLKIILLY